MACHLASQHLKMASDQKACCDRWANSIGFQEDQVWLYHSTQTRGKLSKLQSSWEGPYKVITQGQQHCLLNTSRSQGKVDGGRAVQTGAIPRGYSYCASTLPCYNAADTVVLLQNSSFPIASQNFKNAS
jgi:hypothetical protein